MDTLELFALSLDVLVSEISDMLASAPSGTAVRLISGSSERGFLWLPVPAGSAGLMCPEFDGAQPIF
jgi:hypothetical protein